MIITVPSNYEPHVNTAQIIASQLSDIGIRAKLELVEWATWLDQVYSKAQYQATVIAFTGKIDPNDILGRYTTAFPRNFIKYSNPAFDNSIEAAIVETDSGKRAALYRKCQKIMTADAASVFICDPSLIVATKKNLKGYTFYPVTFIDFSTLYYE
jgi:peptide/nickel transport system substrate-binding protein